MLGHNSYELKVEAKAAEVVMEALAGEVKSGVEVMGVVGWRGMMGEREEEVMVVGEREEEVMVVGERAGAAGAPH
jgi:hypothetical protein